MSQEEVEPVHDTTSGCSASGSFLGTARTRGPEPHRSLSAWVFGASLVVHGSAAVGLHASASTRSTPQPTPQIEIELAPPPPPPPPPEPEPPEPEPEPEKQATPPPPPPPKPVARPVRKAVESAPAAPATRDLPSSDEGTLPPAPPGPTTPPAPPPPPPPPPPEPIIEAKEGANYLKNPRPAYPRIALREGWEGKVLLRVKVLPNGRVGGATVQKSSGRTSLDEAALETVKSWTFVPATQGGQPIAGFVSVPLEFRIN